MMLPGNAIEFEIDGEMYLGLVDPYVPFAELPDTQPAVFPDANGDLLMMTIIPLDQWLRANETEDGVITP